MHASRRFHTGAHVEVLQDEIPTEMACLEKAQLPRLRARKRRNFELNNRDTLRRKWTKPQSSVRLEIIDKKLCGKALEVKEAAAAKLSRIVETFPNTPPTTASIRRKCSKYANGLQAQT